MAARWTYPGAHCFIAMEGEKRVRIQERGYSHFRSQVFILEGTSYSSRWGRTNTVLSSKNTAFTPSTPSDNWEYHKEYDRAPFLLKLREDWPRAGTYEECVAFMKVLTPYGTGVRFVKSPPAVLPGKFIGSAYFIPSP